MAGRSLGRGNGLGGPAGPRRSGLEREVSMHRSTLALCVAVVVVALGMLVPSIASAWAPAGSAAIHPGVDTFTDGAQCTSNFVFSDGANVYLGQAAHCSGTGAPTDTNGCTSASLPIGTAVDVDGASRPGTLV